MDTLPLFTEMIGIFIEKSMTLIERTMKSQLCPSFYIFHCYCQTVTDTEYMWRVDDENMKENHVV